MIDKQAATKIISGTFEKPFDKGRFAYFAKNLLNKIDESKVLHLQGAYIPESFREFVKTYERLGTYTDPEGQKLDILIVYLHKETSLERARTAQRNFVARYLKERGEKEAGLVAFVSPDPGDWRFSFVKMEYRLEETPQGKIKAKEELTPARRLSFLVGENESTHTAQKQLFPILEDDKRNPTLSELEKAFSVEVVTKEFFGKYRELYLDVMESLDSLVENDEVIRKDFAAKGVNTVDFSKKLLGQIVFLYFLQKKGWFGVARDADWGAGSKQFLRELFDGKHGRYKNFFNDILEPLFYEALRIDRSHDDDYYSKFNCKIPFLNGGLFDPINNYDWVHTDILIPNNLFSNTEKTKEGDTGTGILDVFDRYNFTVKEDEPLEKEVAIDPEMLGKVFENLLGVKDRKSKGTYYTPREIVHYMCRESLINYLATAVNTGEAPLRQAGTPQGKLLGERWSAQMALSTPEYQPIIPREDIEDLVRRGELALEHDEIAVRKQIEIERGKIKSSGYSVKLKLSGENARNIDNALANIRVCDPAVGSGAFLVGMMHEIVKCRKVLSTYLGEEEGRSVYVFKRHAIQSCLYGVDIDPGAVEIAKLRLWLSLVVDEEDIRQIKPLPNLDYKIVCGNSLFGYPYEPSGLEPIEKLKEQFFQEARSKEKNQLRNQIDNAIHNLFKNTVKSLGYKVTVDFKVNFSEVFREKSGFDVMMANPPYIRIQLLKNHAPEEVNFFKQRYVAASKGNYDIYVVFVERGLSLLNKAGTLCFILPHKFFNAQYGQPLRDLIAKGKHLAQIVHFGDCQVFAEATNYTCLLFLDKSGKDKCRIVKVNDFIEWGKSGQATEGTIPAVSITAAEWNFTVGKGAALVERLSEMPVKLGDVADIFVGLQTSADDVFIMDLVVDGPQTLKLKSKALNCDWVFEKGLLFPLVSGTDVSRYRDLPERQYILFPYKVDGGQVDLIDFSVISKCYPKTAAYLLRNKGRLEDRERGKFRGLDWHRFGRNQNIGIQGKVKLCIPRLVESLNAAYDAEGKHFLDNVDVGGITLKTEYQQQGLVYLLGLLNSELLRWYFPHVSAPFRGGWLSANRQFLSQLPIRTINFSEPYDVPRHDRMVALVEEMLSLHKQLATAKTDQDKAALQRQIATMDKRIDQLVYQIYELTSEEIAVVEGSVR